MSWTAGLPSVIYFYIGFLESGKAVVQSHIFLTSAWVHLTPLQASINKLGKAKQALFFFL